MERINAESIIASLFQTEDWRPVAFPPCGCPDSCAFRGLTMPALPHPFRAWVWLAIGVGLAVLFACAVRGAPAPLPKAPKPMPAARGYGDGEPDYGAALGQSEILRRFAWTSPDAAWEQYHVARDRVTWLEEGEVLYYDSVAWYAAKVDQEKRREAWYYLAQVLRDELANPGNTYSEWAKTRLQELIGEEAYYAGFMPDALPWWTFQAID